jgi:glycosyltransferase involved in cell wall biosynthesis
MNVLFLMGAYPGYGGVEIVSTILANQFMQKGYGVSIVSFEQPKLEKEPTELSEKVHFYPLSKPTYTKKNAERLHRVIVEDKIDILINQWAVPYFVARLCKKAIRGTSCKLISVHHNVPNTNFRIEQIKIAIREKKGNVLLNKAKLKIVTLFSRLSLRYTISKSDIYLTLSPSFIPIAERYTWLRNNGKFRSLANPLTIEPNSEVKPDKKKEIIYVGRIEYNQKCTYRIIDIWEKLERDYPDWVLRIVGDGPDRENLQRRIENKKLNNVKIEGFQKPMPYYKDASVLLLVSAYEGFPLVLVESMEYGVIPVVYNSFVSVYDLIEDGVDGFIMEPPYSEEEFVKTLELLMSDKEKRKSMTKAAMKKAELYSVDAIATQWSALFNELKQL